MKLYIEGDQYLPGVSEDVDVVIAIHDYGTMTFPEQNGISVAAGASTLIGMKLVRIQIFSTKSISFNYNHSQLVVI